MFKINRKYKSSVFTHLFRESKRGYELYNAVVPGRFPPGTSVKDVTLSNALYMDRVNDLSFILGGKLVVFFEHQSTMNHNMPLRYLFYCSRVYESVTDSKALYGSGRTKIPAPEFYVLYNGKASFHEKAIYKLSEMYEMEPDSEPSLELVVTVININYGYNSEIVKRSEALDGYVSFISKAREFESAGMSVKKAINAAVSYCIDNGILADYFKKHKSEVARMLFGEWKLDSARANWESEARAEGVEIGKVEEREKWESVVAAKDAILAAKDNDLAAKDAEIDRLKSQLKLKQ